ncbi:hypothetical protein FSP39_017875 [Pinctada imbricata]|uniref:PHD-type domain-containing protein n=1 Tax=Pinctada imbricata TaxID=66713 RepID=A0AA88YFJ5_PINIB|nr:hypothetical protein FSP39_017875 [Pinctada imbricata]
MGTPYPCVACVTNCAEDTIQCSKCSKWVHRECVPMSKDQMSTWSAPDLTFLCRRCCFTGSSFDCGASLKRYTT